VATAFAVASFVPGPARAGSEGPIQEIGDLPRNIRITLFSAQEQVQGVNYPGAVKILREFMADNPDNDHFWLRFFLGDYLSHLEKVDEACAELEKCVAMEPRFTEAWLKLGELSYSLERYPRAAEAILEGFELSEEKRPELLYFGAASYILAQQSEKALPVLEQLLTGEYGEPRLEWYRAMISASIDAGAIDRGRDAVAGLLEHFGSNPDAWYLAFQFAASIQDYEQAAVALTVTGYLRPLNRQERIQLGDLYSVIDVPVVAGDYYQEAMADSASAREIERLASAHIAAHNQDEALAVLTRAVREEPTARLYSLLGDLQFMRKDYAASYDAFEQCVRMDPQEGRAYLMMGYCAMELERNHDAVDNLERALAFEDVAERAQSLLERARRRIGSERADNGPTNSDEKGKGDDTQGGGNATTARSNS
jgi:tetratricopeptide (TPR) repeat protein